MIVSNGEISVAGWGSGRQTVPVLFPDEVPTLTDGRVTLRAHTPSDIPRIVEQCNDADSLAWTTVPSPYGERDAAEFVGTLVPGGWTDDSAYLFAVEVDGRFAGSVDLRMRGGGEAEIGFGLHPDARGDRVMRRALGLLLDWAFEQRGVVVVQWRAFVGNWTSRRTVWDLGFSFGPTIPQLLPHREERRDAWTGWIGKDDPREPAEPWLVPSVLETDGLRLRPRRESDAEGVAEAGER